MARHRVGELDAPVEEVASVEEVAQRLYRVKSGNIGPNYTGAIVTEADLAPYGVERCLELEVIEEVELIPVSEPSESLESDSDEEIVFPTQD